MPCVQHVVDNVVTKEQMPSKEPRFRQGVAFVYYALVIPRRPATSVLRGTPERDCLRAWRFVGISFVFATASPFRSINLL